MSKFLRRSLLIFIIKVFRIIVFIFIVISTTFRPICPPAFFRCLSNSETFTELRTTSFIETTWVACSDSVCRVKPPTEFNMTKNCVYSIPCSCGKIYKGETGPPLKVRLEEHRKAIVRGDIEKSGMAENGNHLPLWDKVEIIDRAKHWRIRRLKESAHMLGYNDLLSRPSIELNIIWEPIIKKVRKKNEHR